MFFEMASKNQQNCPKRRQDGKKTTIKTIGIQGKTESPPRPER
jgi:hypothetical protein